MGAIERSSQANPHATWWRRPAIWFALVLVGLAAASAAAFEMWGALALGPILCLAICPVMLLFMWLTDPVAGADDSVGRS